MRRLPVTIAWRYLFAKKSQNVINLISAISVVGVAIGTMALVIILSVFNGFENLVQQLYGSFDPELEISAARGKVFDPTDARLTALASNPDIAWVSPVLTENVLLRFEDRQYVATIKGVDSNYALATDVDNMLVAGEFKLQHDNFNYTIIGQGVRYYLGVELGFANPINIYVPNRLAPVTFDPERAFVRKSIFPSGIFAIEQDYDTRYLFVPMRFARQLLQYRAEVSALELRLHRPEQMFVLQKQLKASLGEAYKVTNRWEKHEMFNKVMKAEKWAIFFILTFILIIASVNTIGSLSMLIIEKQKDIFTLRSIGATRQTVFRVFLYEGWLIIALGALTGLLLGIAICMLQQHFGLVKLSGSGTFIIDAYPVDLRTGDLLAIAGIVMAVGYLAAFLPARLAARQDMAIRD